jgi:hypothetical protein
MKIFILLVFFLTLANSSFASWSQYAYVTPETEFKYKLNVHVEPANSKRTAYLIRLEAVAFPSKQAWLIVTPKPLSSSEQNQRSRFWADKLNTENVESIVPLRPTGIPIFPQSNEKKSEKFYDVVIPADEIDRTYIYIDFPALVYDGGYFYSIDLSTYLKTDENRE